MILQQFSIIFLLILPRQFGYTPRCSQECNRRAPKGFGVHFKDASIEASKLREKCNENI
jgi:hypothetical protein